MAERIVTGVKELDRKLKLLDRKAANRAARAGLNKGARLSAKKIKAEIPSKQKSIRKAIGSSGAKKQANGITTAKAGAGVGKRTKAVDRANKPGVGISKQNIHWWVLGTNQRTRKGGGSTGAMPPHPIVKRAVGSGVDIIAAIKEGTMTQFAKEVAKL